MSSKRKDSPGHDAPTDTPVPDAAEILVGLDAARQPLRQLLDGLDTAAEAVMAAEALGGTVERLVAERAVAANDLDALKRRIAIETAEHETERQAWITRQHKEVTEHGAKLQAYEEKVLGDLGRKQALTENTIAGAQEADRQRHAEAEGRMATLREDIADLSAKRAGEETRVAELQTLNRTLREEIATLQARINRLAGQAVLEGGGA